MTLRISFVLFVMAIASPASIHAGDPDVTRKAVKKLVEEIELVPSLYAKGDESAQIKALPKFSAKKLLEYALDKEDGFARQREQYRSKRDRYTAEHPLRASIFEAAEAIDAINRKELVTSLTPKDTTPKGKTAILLKQSYLGQTLFKLEQVRANMESIDEHRAKEKSKHWQANFDFARARFDLNLVYLFELNFTIGKVRADALPELGVGEIGWQIVPQAKLGITESKAKALAKDAKMRLKKMQEDYAETPWAFFAERESQRELGMNWVGRKK